MTQVTVTVDGGANQWIKYIGNRTTESVLGKSKKYLPMLVICEINNISPSLLEQFKQTKTTIIDTLDIMESDYTKALIQVGQYANEHNIKLDGIHVLAETAGLDQIISNVNTLYKYNNNVNNAPVIQIASDSLTWLLKPGKHRILIPDIILKNKSWCALIPFGDSNNCVTTSGLKWNLSKTCMKFGGLVSTSNTYNGEPEVTIDTNVPLVWSMGIEILKA